MLALLLVLLIISSIISITTIIAFTIIIISGSLSYSQIHNNRGKENNKKT